MENGDLNAAREKTPGIRLDEYVNGVLSREIRAMWNEVEKMKKSLVPPAPKDEEAEAADIAFLKDKLGTMGLDPKILDAPKIQAIYALVATLEVAQLRQTDDEAQKEQ